MFFIYCWLMNFHLFLLPVVVASSLIAKTVMLDPAGHAKQPGRQLYESFERAETYRCVEQIKKIIEAKSDVRVLVTRAPGEDIVPLQSASFANRAGVDLFMTVHLVKESAEQPSINLAYLTYDTLLDQTHKDYKKGDFVPVYQAHCPALATTKRWSEQMVKQLTAVVPKRWSVAQQTLALPLKELQGVVAPAVMLELGVHTDREYAEITEHLAETIMACLR